MKMLVAGVTILAQASASRIDNESFLRAIIHYIDKLPTPGTIQKQQMDNQCLYLEGTDPYHPTSISTHAQSSQQAQLINRRIQPRRSCDNEICRKHDNPLHIIRLAILNQEVDNEHGGKHGGGLEDREVEGELFAHGPADEDD